MTPFPEPSETAVARMTDGAELHIRRYGNPQGTRMVISHGNGFAVDGYRVFWEPLAERFDVVVFDMRNHGLSTPTGADGHHYQQMARDIEVVAVEVATRFGARPTVGVFHSMSARAAMKQAMEGGWLWDALILYDPPNVPPRGHPQHEAMRVFELKLVEFAANRPDRFDSVEDLAKLYAETRASSRWHKQAMADMAKAVLRPASHGPGDAPGFELVCRRELEASIYLAALTLDLWPEASAYAGPVKLIGADHTMERNTATAKANHALAMENGYRYDYVPETGHLMQIERPEACREAMLTFLEELKLA